MTVPMSTKRQFKLWLEKEVDDRLQQAAERFSNRSAQQVVEELIDLYLPVWISVNVAINRAVDQQTRRMAPRSQENNHGLELSPTSRTRIPLVGSGKKRKKTTKVA